MGINTYKMTILPDKYILYQKDKSIIMDRGL